MELNSKMKGLDESLCSFVLPKDPTRKSSSKSVFMGKKELETFYGKMYSKANQDLKLDQKRSTLCQDRNRLLEKQEQRIRQKIYTRTFYNRAQSSGSKNLSNKENIKMNQKPLITDNSFKASKLIKEKSDSKFLVQANEELLMSEYFDKNSEVKQRRIKTTSHESGLLRLKSVFQNINENLKQANKSIVLIEQRNSDEGMPHRKAELIELYQKLYEQFTKKKTKIIQLKSCIQSKFSESGTNIKPKIIKAPKSSLKLVSIPIKRVLMKL